MEATLMKPFGLIPTGILLLVLGAVAPTHAQNEQREQDAKAPRQEQQGKAEKQQQKQRQQQDGSAKQRPQQQAEGRQEPQQKQRQQQDNSAKQRPQQQAEGRQEPQQKQRQLQDNSAKQKQQKQANGQQEQRQQQANRPSQPGHQGLQGKQRAAWQDHRAHNWQSEHRSWQQRGGYKGYRIPEDRYRGHFGPGHAFRIYSYPVVVVGGYPRFQYGGFWFSILDPWPEYWSDEWYDNDDVYIDYSGDGYYLYNRSYPRDRIAINVYVR
jgi:hypothetical protein